MIPNIRSDPAAEDSRYRFAPAGWRAEDAVQLGAEQGMELGADHLELLSSLQEYFSRHDKPDQNMRELHDALDERFHARGGMKYLYKLFPGGPVAQGCQLAGLSVPAGAVSHSFGSVQ